MSGSGTWGAGVWGQNQWNDLADPTFTVTGIALSASLGDETTVGEINLGWGRLGGVILLGVLQARLLQQVMPLQLL